MAGRGIGVCAWYKRDETWNCALLCLQAICSSDVNRPQLEQIAQMLDAGTLQSTVSSVPPLEAAREAHEMLESKQARPRGTIVLQTRA